MAPSHASHEGGADGGTRKARRGRRLPQSTRRAIAAARAREAAAQAGGPGVGKEEGAADEREEKLDSSGEPGASHLLLH